MKLGSPPSSSLSRNESGGGLLRTLLQINSTVPVARLQQQDSVRDYLSRSSNSAHSYLKRTCCLLSRTRSDSVRRTIFYLLLFLFGGLTTAMGAVHVMDSEQPPSTPSTMITYDLSSNNPRLFCQQVLRSVQEQRPFDIKSVCGSYSHKYLISERVLKNMTLAACQMLHDRLVYMNVQANYSLNDFQSVINRLSCPPKFNQSSAVSSPLDDDTYSLSSACSDCQESYRNWSCAFYFPEYNGSENTTDADNLRLLCTETSRRCPLLIPIDVHSGQPFFTCSGVSALQDITMRVEPCDYRVDSCFITERYPNTMVQHEETAANNIGRDRISAVMLLLNLLLPVVHLIRGHLRLV